MSFTVTDLKRNRTTTHEDNDLPGHNNAEKHEIGIINQRQKYKDYALVWL